MVLSICPSGFSAKIVSHLSNNLDFATLKRRLLIVIILKLIVITILTSKKRWAILET